VSNLKKCYICGKFIGEDSGTECDNCFRPICYECGIDCSQDHSFYCDNCYDCICDKGEVDE